MQAQTIFLDYEAEIVLYPRLVRAPGINLRHGFMTLGKLL
jgi:hypothetical protein